MPRPSRLLLHCRRHETKGSALKELLQFAILGLGAGAVYALLGQGIVLTYRGSGIVNFGQGALAMVGAFVFWDLHDQHHWSFAPSATLAVLFVALMGALIHLIIMRPLANSSPLVRVIAGLAMVSVLTAGADLYWGGDQRLVTTSLPRRPWAWGDIRVTSDRIYLAIIAVAITVVLWAVYRFTRFGLAVVAAAEDERSAAALGWSPDLLASVNWAAGGALAALAGIFIVPITGLQASSLALIVIAALAAALLGGFTSFGLTMVGGLVIGISQSWATHYVKRPGAADAVPFLIITAVLLVRGRALPLRSHVLERLPKLGPDKLRARYLLVPVVLALLMINVFPLDWNAALSTSLIMAVMMLSVVVLTGFAGQVSLAQMALGGVGAMIASRMVSKHHVPLELALPVGVATSIVVGLVFALPALRTRGINLAVVTLGLGLAVQAAVFNNSRYTGGPNGTNVGKTKFFGIDIDRLNHPDRYGIFVLAWLVLCIVVVLNVRRGRAGRRLIAVRTNERAAASLGVGIFGAKLYGFAVSAAIVGIGGILYGFQDRQIVFDRYSPFTSINVVLLAVLGGLGYVIGPVFGSVVAVGGVGALISKHIGVDNNWIVLAGGLILLVQLIAIPDGMASHNPFARFARKKSGAAQAEPTASAAAAAAAPELAAEPVRAAQLDVTGITVRVGGIYAVHDVSLTVRTGEVVGLIGPNGAGKTTLIDAITGFNKPVQGAVVLDGVDISRRSAARRARSGLSRTFQSLELFEDLTVRDNILAGADHDGMLPYVTDVFWPRQQHLPATARRAIRDLDLIDVLELTVSELPYGQRRLVSIARALASTPSILMLDEPAAGLSDAETAELRTLIRRLAEDWGVGVLLVEHDMSLVMAVCDRIVALESGELIAEGRPEEIARNERVRAAYLGDASPETASADAPSHTAGS